MNIYIYIYVSLSLSLSVSLASLGTGSLCLPCAESLGACRSFVLPACVCKSLHHWLRSFLPATLHGRRLCMQLPMPEAFRAKLSRTILNPETIKHAKGVPSSIPDTCQTISRSLTFRQSPRNMSRRIGPHTQTPQPSLLREVQATLEEARGQISHRMVSWHKMLRSLGSDKRLLSSSH